MQSPQDKSSNTKNFRTFLEGYDAFWKKGVSDFPQCKYVAKPIYKMLGGNKNPLVSIPATFAAMHYLFHDIPGNMVGLYCDFKYSSKPATLASVSKTMLKANPKALLFWTALSAPIAVNKYLKNEQDTSEEDENRPSIR